MSRILNMRLANWLRQFYVELDVTTDSDTNTGYPLILNRTGGKVGIKTTTPQVQLDVNGDGRVAGQLEAPILNATKPFPESAGLSNLTNTWSTLHGGGQRLDGAPLAARHRDPWRSLQLC